MVSLLRTSFITMTRVEKDIKVIRSKDKEGRRMLEHSLNLASNNVRACKNKDDEGKGREEIKVM